MKQIPTFQQNKMNFSKMISKIEERSNLIKQIQQDFKFDLEWLFSFLFKLLQESWVNQRESSIHLTQCKRLIKLF